MIGATACGGDGGGPLDRYFGDLEELAEDWDDARQKLDLKAGEEILNTGSEEERIAVFVDFFRNERALFAEFLTGFAAISAPEATGLAHDAALTTSSALLEMYDDAARVRLHCFVR